MRTLSISFHSTENSKYQAAVMKYFSNILVIAAAVINCFLGLTSESSCDVKSRVFRKLPQYANRKPAEPPLNKVNTPSAMDCSTECYNYDDCVGYIYNRNSDECSLYNTSFYSLTLMDSSGSEAYGLKVFDCYDVMKNTGANNSGVYTIVPRDNGKAIQVYCEISPTDGGWLVFQRRTDGSEDFFRTWNEYRDGFGNLTNEFWLGNTNIYRITRQRDYDLKIELEDFKGVRKYALYTKFSISGEDDYFRLSVASYSGNAGDSFISAKRAHNGMRFSTKDKDNDLNSGNCAQNFKGAWWYEICYSSNLNGVYLRGAYSGSFRGVTWYPWKGYSYSLKKTVMKIRPSDVAN